MNDNNHSTSLLDLFIIWAGTIVSHVSSSDVMVWATIIFTLLKTYVLIRDEFFKKER